MMAQEQYYMMVLSIVTVICISIVTIYAIYSGIDGAIYKTGIGAMFGIASGLGGYLYGKRRRNK